MSDATVEIEIDKININKIDINNNGIDINNDRIDNNINNKINNNIINNKPHNGKPITEIETSPNGKYLVTYSEDDHSIVGWDVDKNQFKLEFSIKISDQVGHIRISDDKRLAYIYATKKLGESGKIKIYDMNNDQQIKLDCEFGDYYNYCTFNLKNELILYNNFNRDYVMRKIILIYSTRTKNNKWKCKKLCEIPEDIEFISISKYDKLYLFSNNSIYEWDLFTEKSIKIFGNDEEMKYSYYYNTVI
ncbi:hypothetical protein RhiirB3_468091 [Rhizophagus irregularis]|nr:hypothetical protein RhiirB3_468091 [Rhizophagus irregularis]